MANRDQKSDQSSSQICLNAAVIILIVLSFGSFVQIFYLALKSYTNSEGRFSRNTDLGRELRQSLGQFELNDEEQFYGITEELSSWRTTLAEDNTTASYRRFLIKNSAGLELELLSLGATITAIRVPSSGSGDSKGKVDITLGFDRVEDYLPPKNNPYFGSTVGRVANRIRGGKFEIDGIKFQVDINNGDNHLHGGFQGFNFADWSATLDSNSVTFTHLSPDGDCGYPGDLLASVRYQLTESGEIRIEFRATSTAPTIVNMANHAYFNLGGHNAGQTELVRHRIQLNANHYMPIDNHTIPTGEIREVGGSPFDLRTATILGKVLHRVPTWDDQHPGFDHNFVVAGNSVSRAADGFLTFVARASHKASGRSLEVYSNQPGVQFYTGNFLPKSDEGGEAAPIAGKKGASYSQHGGFCLETQMYPDAINKPGFGLDPVLRPGKLYRHDLVYKVGFLN